jgi:hypothetical protein
MSVAAVGKNRLRSLGVDDVEGMGRHAGHFGQNGIQLLGGNMFQHVEANEEVEYACRLLSKFRHRRIEARDPLALRFSCEA